MSSNSVQQKATRMHRRNWAGDMEHGDVATLEAADSQQTLLLVLRGMQAWAGLSSTAVKAEGRVRTTEEEGWSAVLIRGRHGLLSLFSSFFVSCVCQ